jgi:hypothetical protein
VIGRKGLWATVLLRFLSGASPYDEFLWASGAIFGDDLLAVVMGSLFGFYLLHADDHGNIAFASC